MYPFAQSQLDQLNDQQFTSLIDMFDHCITGHADAVAFSSGDKHVTFAQIERASRHLAAYLVSHLKLQQGDRVAIQLPNVYEYAIATWACIRSGLVIVNTNPMYTPRELTHQFNDSQAAALIVSHQLADSTLKVLPDTAIKHVITDQPVSGLTSLKDATDTGEMFSFTPAQCTMNSIAVLQYTGGTTGLSKGAVLTHANLFAAQASTRAIFPVLDDLQEIVIAPMPVYHIYGFLMSMIGTFLSGGRSVLIANPRNIQSIIDEMLRYSATGLAGVNTLFQGLMAHPSFGEIDFSRYVSVIAGGTALIKEIADEWHERTGNDIQEGYGLSETASALTVNAPGHRKLGTVGKVLDCLQVRVIDSQGKVLPEGSTGEITVRGPVVMQGYWQRADATADAIDADGYFKTGDIGFVDAEGFLKIVDRVKDMIIVSGFNVYPNEIEAVVYGHPAVTECAAIGVNSDQTGEAIKLFVVSQDKSLTSEQLIDFCREQLTAYKVPKQIVFKNDLPKSAVGKILRRELRTA